jgi:hypothetical protein
LRCIFFCHAGADPILKLKNSKYLSSCLIHLEKREVLKGISLGYIPIFLNIDRYFNEGLFLNLVALAKNNSFPISLNFFPDISELSRYRKMYPHQFLAVRLNNTSFSSDLAKRLINLVDLLIIDLSVCEGNAFDCQMLVKGKVGDCETSFVTTLGGKSAIL